MPPLFLSALFIALTALPLGSGIQCFYCTSESDSRCVDTRRFEAQYQTDQPSECTQEAVDTTLARTHQHIPSPDGEKGNYVCVKIEIANRHAVGNRTIIRGCAQGPTRKFDPCTDISNHFLNAGDIWHCSTCKTDQCNAASTLALTSWLSMPLFVELIRAMH